MMEKISLIVSSLIFIIIAIIFFLPNKNFKNIKTIFVFSFISLLEFMIIYFSPWKIGQKTTAGEILTGIIFVALITGSAALKFLISETNKKFCKIIILIASFIFVLSLGSLLLFYVVAIGMFTDFLVI